MVRGTILKVKLEVTHQQRRRREVTCDWVRVGYVSMTSCLINKIIYVVIFKHLLMYMSQC